MLLGNVTGVTKAFGAQKSLVPNTRLLDSLMKTMESVKHKPVPMKGDYQRSSNLSRVCPREIQLQKRLNVSAEAIVDAKLSWIFNTGHAIHHQFQEVYLQTLGDVFQGWWGSNDGEDLQVGEELNDSLKNKWIAKPKDGKDYHYVELEFCNEEYRLTGHCDGVLVWGEDDVEIFELKTISSRGFKTVDPNEMGSPKPEHVLQVNAYMWLTGLERARIVYVNKDMNTMLPKAICEHVIDRDESVISEIKELLKKCINASDSEPSRNEALYEKHSDCKTKSSYRAKDCAFRTECFKCP